MFDDAQRAYLLTLQSVAQAAQQVGDQARYQKAMAVLGPYLGQGQQ
jgi:hypothetical protein